MTRGNSGVAWRRKGEIISGSGAGDETRPCWRGVYQTLPANSPTACFITPLRCSPTCRVLPLYCFNRAYNRHSRRARLPRAGLPAPKLDARDGQNRRVAVHAAALANKRCNHHTLAPYRRKQIRRYMDVALLTRMALCAGIAARHARHALAVAILSPYSSYNSFPASWPSRTHFRLPSRRLFRQATTSSALQYSYIVTWRAW